MFTHSSLMLYTKDNRIYRIVTDNDTQNTLCSNFSESYANVFEGKNKIIFDGKYAPEEDELLCINSFQIDDCILDAIRMPISMETAPSLIYNIKFLFIGQKEESESSEIFKIAFQKFKNEQYIVPSKINLFFSHETYIRDNRYGLTINDLIDCFYDNGELLFPSYHYARQIFPLNSYYRLATNKDIEEFITNDALFFQSPDNFKSFANTNIRRKIAQIQDFNILKDYTPDQIKAIAESIGIQIEIKIQDSKIVIPNDKEQIIRILGFLGEEVYVGPFSQFTYLANSKRQIA